MKTDEIINKCVDCLFCMDIGSINYDQCEITEQLIGIFDECNCDGFKDE